MSNLKLVDFDDDKTVNQPPLEGDTLVLWLEQDPRDNTWIVTEEIAFKDLGGEAQVGVEWDPRRERYVGLFWF